MSSTAQLALYALAPTAVLIYFAKKWFAGAQCKSKNRLDGKIVIVTGSNCGIGYEAALDLAKRGAHVILACRDMKKAQLAQEKIIAESKNNKVDIEKLDCASFQSVREFADRFKSKYNRLDILINNAGLTQEKFRKTIDGFETTFQVNYLSTFLLTNLLIDMLKKSSPSRVVNVSALAGKWTQINWADINLEKNYGQIGAYAQNDGITAYSLHPGGVETDIFRNIKKNPLYAVLFYLMQPIHWLAMKTPKDGAQTTIYCAVDDDVINNTGCYFDECKVDAHAEGSKLDNAQKLWKLSENLIGIDCN